ncbi:shikimate dehydrogenase [Cytobacillus oceanisediminis]|uniref:Shikimate dehydrogenase (NADP(+)) n=1 Tax=Niallia alba TaxID=2729105 RepID=A0A7Y0KA81_9BACI|nr:MULTISPECIES: shikimate dehydrogenase [Bacillaceae]MBQ6447979.1 shikimate dehydrogenase [Bacillus sp. (in: firmicutes)]MBZ9533022.1 shikimate dehydrogenase [Cytobacillus oceanisediminis]NMO78536.1 shikimate dehydrogenase [Niallia alba]
MKNYAVIGDPIQHSMSPVMHNDLFQFYGLDAEMKKVHIKTEMLEVGLQSLRDMNIDGFNVTVPYKQAIIPYLDELDPLSEAIGAVNTVVCENGKWMGYNTDGEGYLKGLLEQLPDLKQRRTLIVGSGGAARGIYFTLAHYGVQQIDICNRTLVKAVALKEACPFPVKTNIMEVALAEKMLGEYELIIQTTSIGMSPKIGASPIKMTNLKREAFVSDIIYNPLETKILSEAKARGAKTQNGIDMFVYQGALAFERWQGFFPDTDRMRYSVLTQLGG